MSPVKGGTKMKDINSRAEILIQALPHIRRYNNKTVVVKYGGNAMKSPELKSAVMSDIVLLTLVGIRVVLVHGGGPEITETLNRMGIESHFVGGLRYTDAETAKVVQMVLSGKTNKDLVALLETMGGKAIGLCGIDGGMLRAKKLISEEGDLGFVGDITSVDTSMISDSLEHGHIPVIATVAADEQGNVYNINADTAAARIASELRAENLILMTDIAGILRDREDESTLIQEIRLSDVPALKHEGVISGGMIPKVDCCVEAIRRGVKRAVIIDGRTPHSILIELLTDEGVGTMFR